MEPLETPNSLGGDGSAQEIFSNMYTQEESDGDVPMAEYTPHTPEASASSPHTAVGGTKKRNMTTK